MEELENVIPEPEIEKRGLVFRLGRSLFRGLWEILSTIVPAVLIALFINVYVAQATVIDGPSMQPNLYYTERK